LRNDFSRLFSAIKHIRCEITIGIRQQYTACCDDRCNYPYRTHARNNAGMWFQSKQLMPHTVRIARKNEAATLVTARRLIVDAATYSSTPGALKSDTHRERELTPQLSCANKTIEVALCRAGVATTRVANITGTDLNFLWETVQYPFFWISRS